MPTSRRAFASTTARHALLSLATFLAATAARGEPFQLYAQYDRRPNADAKLQTQLKIAVAPSDTVLADTPDYAFAGIFIAPKSDQLSKQTLSIIRNFVFIEDGRALDVRPPGDALDTPKLLVSPNDLKPGGAVSRHDIEVRWKLKRDYLCRMELELREGQIADDKAPPARVAIAAVERFLKPSKNRSPDQESESSFAATIFAQSLNGSKMHVFYSFCDALSSRVDWDAIAKDKAVNPQRQSPQALKKEGRRLLLQALSQPLKDKGGLAGVSEDFDVRDAPDVPESASNVFIATKLHFSVVKRPDALFRFTESKMWCPDGQERCPIHDVVDQSSTIALEPNKRGADALDIVGNVSIVDRFNVFVLYKDGSGNLVKKKVSVGDDGTLAFALGDELNQEVQMVAELPVNPVDKTDGAAAILVVRSDKVTVRSIGFSVTVPIFSELFTIAKQNPVNLSAEKSQSSIPISWAYDFTKNRGKHVAITFPGMISVNPRSAPTLSKTIRFYVHGSLILPTAGDAGDAKVAFGLGAYLFESVAFAWAMDTDGHHYSMLGLNIPEAVKFFQ